MPLPPATQTYNPALTPHQRVVRRAVCPIHNRQSSAFVGAGQMDGGRETWKFHCSAANVKGVKGKADHIFAAAPDRSAPRTPAELASWVEEQLAKAAGVGH